MKTLSAHEFEELLCKHGWSFKQTITQEDSTEHFVNEWDGGLEEVVEKHSHTTVWGYAYIEATLNDTTISYSESYKYNKYDPYSLETGGENGPCNHWDLGNIKVVDENEDELADDEITDLALGEFHVIDYSEIKKGLYETLDIDVDEDEDEDSMETITLEIDNAPNIKFTGEMIGGVSSSPDQAMNSSWSGETGRWTILRLYKTKGGKYICHQIGKTQWQGERDRFSGKVCDTLEEVVEFFGQRWLAKELYCDAGMQDVAATEVE